MFRYANIEISIKYATNKRESIDENENRICSLNGKESYATSISRNYSKYTN